MMFVHRVEHVAEISVALGEQRGILIAKMLHLLRRFLHRLVERPIEMPGVGIVGIAVLVAAVGEERLVRIEGLYLKKPAVLIGIAADEVESGGEGLRVGR